jgi:hypothetical protein
MQASTITAAQQPATAQSSIITTDLLKFRFRFVILDAQLMQLDQFLFVLAVIIHSQALLL